MALLLLLRPQGTSNLFTLTVRSAIPFNMTDFVYIWLLAPHYHPKSRLCSFISKTRVSSLSIISKGFLIRFVLDQNVEFYLRHNHCCPITSKLEETTHGINFHPFTAPYDMF